MESVQGRVLPAVTDSRLVLRSRLGAITLVLLCGVQFVDIVDSAIVNVALPSRVIRGSNMKKLDIAQVTPWRTRLRRRRGERGRVVSMAAIH